MMLLTSKMDWVRLVQLASDKYYSAMLRLTDSSLHGLGEGNLQAGGQTQDAGLGQLKGEKSSQKSGHFIKACVMPILLMCRVELVAAFRKF